MPFGEANKRQQQQQYCFAGGSYTLERSTSCGSWALVTLAGNDRVTFWLIVCLFVFFLLLKQRGVKLFPGIDSTVLVGFMGEAHYCTSIFFPFYFTKSVLYSPYRLPGDISRFHTHSEKDICIFFSLLFFHFFATANRLNRPEHPKRKSSPGKAGCYHIPRPIRSSPNCIKYGSTVHLGPERMTGMLLSRTSRRLQNSFQIVH